MTPTPEIIEAAQRAYLAKSDEIEDLDLDPDVARQLCWEAALTAALSSQWRTIESAPKDGTLILIYEPEGEMTVVRYEDGPFPWVIPDGASSYRLDVPTHWQPLPPPPEERKE